MRRKLTLVEKHQKRIALDTLKMPDAMVGVMGGMTKAEAMTFLESIGWTFVRIKNNKTERR
jgi:hypothetical protein